jgi:hypothetical protein
MTLLTSSRDLVTVYRISQSALYKKLGLGAATGYHEPSTLKIYPESRQLVRRLKQRMGSDEDTHVLEYDRGAMVAICCRRCR